MTKEKLNDNRRFLTMAVSIAAVALLVVVMGAILWTSPPGDADNSYEYTVTYNPNGAKISGSNADADPVSAHYDGIISTEYNPEYWYDDLPVSTPGNLPDNVSNWVGPTSDQIVKTVVKLKVAGNEQNPVQYKLVYPEAYEPVSAVGADQRSIDYVVFPQDPEDYIEKVDGKWELTLTARGDNTSKDYYTLIISLKVSTTKVFGGWSTAANSGRVYLPGDVVPDTVEELYAYWIEPDMYSKTVTVNNNNWSNHKYTIESSALSLQDHLDVGKTNANNSALALGGKAYEGTNDGDNLGKFTVTVKNNGNYNSVAYNVSFGNARQGPSIFGSIYHLVDNVNMVGSLPSGTYRSENISSKITITATGAYGNAGDVVIDNVQIVGPTGKSAHGGEAVGIYGAGHILIMGKGLVTSEELQVFGGVTNNGSNLTAQIDGDIYTPEMDDKVMVSKATGTVSVKIATCIIIHSGVYFNAGASCQKGSVGSQQVTDRCAYMVFKGGSVIDTLYGSSAYGSNSKDYSDVYLYLTGAFMPGDDYLDTMTGDYTGDPNSKKLRDHYNLRDFPSMKDVSVVNGGPRKAVTTGDTHVFITDHASVYDVTGSGRENDSGVKTSNLEISGAAIVRHAASGGAMNAIDLKVQIADHTNVTILDKCMVASVYGAGYDIWAAPSSSNTTMFGVGTTININMSGGTVGNIYGGGYRGSIGEMTNPDNLTITINISGGTVVESVYGGGSGGVDKAKHSDTAGTRYNDNAKGWSDTTGYSKVYGNINLNITGGSIGGSVYGGGKSVPQLSNYKGHTFSEIKTTKLVAQVFGDIKVTIDGDAVISGSVYGGGKGVEWSYTEGTYEVADTTKTPLMTANGFMKVDWCTNGGNQNIEYQSGNRYSILYNSSYNPSSIRSYMYSGDYLKYAQVSGDVEVYVKGGTVTGSVYGGGSFGVISGTSGTGNTYVEITGGQIRENVYGGGLGIDTIVAVSGKRIVNIDYGAVAIGRNIIEGSVYGGSSIGDDGDKANFPDLESEYSSYADKDEHSSTVIVNQAYIGDPALSQDSSLYGGGFMGKTFGNAYVYVGYQYVYKDDENPDDPSKNSPFKGHLVSYELQDPSKKKIITVNSIYAGGNITTEGGEVAKPYDMDLVMGFGKVSINGNGANNGISINGSIMGSGNSCNTRWSSTIDISDLDNTENEIKGIHRASELTISQSKLYITSRSTLTDVAGAPKDLSLFNIGKLYLKYDTALTITAPADYIYEYYSYSKDNKPTTLTSPSNRINFTTGSTFYIRDERDLNGDGIKEIDYGSVSGYTLIQSLSQTGSGAYVIADQASSYGGFVITKEGTYKEADFSVFPLSGKNLKCWFISGTQNKVVTMNLPFNGTETETKQSTIGATLDIMKMQSDTDMRYTGSTLTSVSTDYDGNSFEFIRPGTETEGYEFGLLIGYREQGDNTANLMYADKERTLNVVGNNEIGYHTEKVRGTYYSDDPDEREGSLEPQTEGVYTTVPLAPVNLVSSSKDAGTYKLNLLFTGKPQNTTMYIGYMVINLQEVTVVSYESTDSQGNIITSTNTMVANNINIRVDLYVIGSGDPTADNDYRVVLKADEDVESNLCSGYTEILIPTGFIMGKLTLQDVRTEYVPDGQSITISAYKNGDNTTGWMTVNDPVTWTQRGSNAESPTVGTMSGTVVATIRYTIDDFTYPDLQEGQKPQFSLYFQTVLKDGTTVNSIVTVVIQKKDMRAVTFHDEINNLSETLYYPDGSYISANSWKDMGFNFIGWYTDSEFMNMFDYNTPITKDVSLYARFSFIVTFDNMNGTSSRMYVAADRNGAILTENMMPRPINQGYELKGWYKDQEGIVAWDYAFDTVKSNTTLYAKWVGVEVKINFYYWDSNDSWVLYGGTEHPDDMSVAELKSTISAQAPYVDAFGNRYSDSVGTTMISEMLYNSVFNPDREYTYLVTANGFDTIYAYKVYNGTEYVDITDTTLQKNLKNLNGFSFKSTSDGKYYKMIDTTHYRCISDGTWSVKTVSLDNLSTEFGITCIDGNIVGFTVYKDESLFKYEGGTYYEYIGIEANSGWLELASAPTGTYYKDKDGDRFYVSDHYLYYRGEYNASLVKRNINATTLKDQFGNLYDRAENPTYFTTTYNGVDYKYVISTGQYYKYENSSWTPCSDPGIIFKRSGSTDNYTLLTKEYVSNPYSYTMIWLDTLYYPTVRYGSSFGIEDPKQSTSENPMYAMDYAQINVQELIGTDKFIRWQVFPDNDPSGPTSYGVYTDTNLTSNMINLKDKSWGDGKLEINLYALTARVAISLEMDKNVNDASAKVTAPSSFLVYPTPTAMTDTGEYFDTSAPLHPDYFTEKGTGTYANKYKRYTDGSDNYFYKIVAKTIQWSGGTAVEVFNVGTAYHIDFTDTEYHATVPSLALYDESSQLVAGYTVSVTNQSLPYSNNKGPDGLYHIYCTLTVTSNDPSYMVGSIEGGTVSFNVKVGEGIPESYLSDDGKTRYDYDSLFSYYYMREENYFEAITYQGGDDNHDYYTDKYGNIYQCDAGADIYTTASKRIIVKKVYGADTNGVQYKIDSSGHFQVYAGIDDYIYEHGLDSKNGTTTYTYSTRPEVVEGYEMGMDGNVYESTLYTGEKILFYYDKGLSFTETTTGSAKILTVSGKTYDNTSIPGSLWPDVNGYGQLNYNLSHLNEYYVNLTDKYIWIFQKSTALSVMPAGTAGMQVVTEGNVATKYTMSTVCKPFSEVDSDEYAEDLSILLPQDGTDAIVAIYYSDSSSGITFKPDGTINSGTATLLVKYTVKTSSMKTEVDLDKMIEREQNHPGIAEKINSVYKDWSYDYATNTLSGTINTNVQFFGTNVKVSSILDGSTGSAPANLDTFLAQHNLGTKTAGTPDTYSTTDGIKSRYAMDLDGDAYVSTLTSGGTVSFYYYEGIKFTQVSYEDRNMVLKMTGKTSDNTSLTGSPWASINGYGFIDINLLGLTGVAGKTLKVYQTSTALSLLPSGTEDAEAISETKFTQLLTSVAYNELTDNYAGDIHILIPQDGTEVTIEIYDSSKEEGNLIVRFVIDTTDLRTEVNLDEMTTGHSIDNATQINPDYKDWCYNNATWTVSGVIGINTQFLGTNITIGSIINGETMADPSWVDCDPVTGYFYKADNPNNLNPSDYDRYVKIDDTTYKMIDWKSEAIPLGDEDENHEYKDTLGLNTVWKDYYESAIKASGRYEMGLDGDAFVSTLTSGGSVSFYADKNVVFSEQSREGNSIVLTISGKTSNNSSIEGSPSAFIRGYAFMDISLTGLTGMAGKTIILAQTSSAMSLLPSRATGAQAIDDTVLTRVVDSVAYNSLNDTYSKDLHIQIPQDGTDITIEIYEMMEDNEHLLATFTIETTGIVTEIDLDQLTAGHHISSQINQNYEDWSFDFGTKTLSGTVKSNVSYIGTDIVISGTSFTEQYVKGHGLDQGTGPYSSSIKTMGRYQVGLDGDKFESPLTTGGKVYFYADKGVSYNQSGSDNNFTLTLSGTTASNTTLLDAAPWTNINGYGFIDINLTGLTGVSGQTLVVYQKSTALSLLASGTAGASAADGQYTEYTKSVVYNDLTDTFAGDVSILIPQDGTSITLKVYIQGHPESPIVTYTIVTTGLDTLVDLDNTAAHPASAYTPINANYADWTLTISGMISTISGTVGSNAKFMGTYVMIGNGINKASFLAQGFSKISDSPILVGLNVVYSDYSETVYSASRTLLGAGIAQWIYSDEHRPVYMAIWNSHTAGTGRWSYTDLTTGEPCDKRSDFYLLTSAGAEYVNVDDNEFAKREWYTTTIHVNNETHLDQFGNHYNLNDLGEYVLDYSIVWVAERSYISKYVTTTPMGVDIWESYELLGDKEIPRYENYSTPITDQEEIASLIARYGIPDDQYTVKQEVMKDYGEEAPRYIQHNFQSTTNDDVYQFTLAKVTPTSGFVIVGKQTRINGVWTYYSVMNPLVPVPTYLAGQPMNSFYYKDKYSNQYIEYENIEYTCVSGSDTYYEFTFKLNEATRNGYKLSGWHNTHVNTDDALYPTSGLYRTLKLFYHEVDGRTVISKEVLDATDSLGNQVTFVTIDYEMYEAESTDYEYYSYWGKNLPRLDDPEHMYGVTYLALWSPIEYTVSVTSSPNGTMNVFKVNSDGTRTPITKSATVKYGDRIELTYSPNGVYQFNKWNVTGEFVIDDEYSTSTTMVIHGNCSITVSDIGERVVILPIRFDDGILSDDDREKVSVNLRNTITQEEYPMQKTGHENGAEEFREYIPLNSSDPNEEYEVLVYYEGDPSPYKMVGTFRVEKDNDLTFEYDIISARIVDKIFLSSAVPDYTEIDGARLENGAMIVSYEINSNIVVSVTRYVGVMTSYLEGNYEGYIINNPYNDMPPVQLTIAAGFDYTVYEGFPNIDSSGEEYFEINTQWNYHSGHTFEETTVTFDLNWTRTDKPADIIVKMTTNSSPRYDVVFVAGNNMDTTSGSGLTRETEIGGFRGAFTSATAKFTDPENPSMYIGNGKAIQGWYYDSAFTDPIQNIGGIILNDNVISKLEYYKDDGVYHVYAKVMDENKIFTIGVDVETQDTTGDGYTKINAEGEELNLMNDVSELSGDTGFDIKNQDGSYSSSIVASGRYAMGLDGNPYSTSITVGAGTFYANNGVTFYQTARDGKYVNLSISGLTTNNTAITGSPWTEITGYGFFDLNLRPSGDVEPALLTDLYVWVYQKSTALSIRTSVDANEVINTSLGGFTESIKSYSYKERNSDPGLEGEDYINDIHVLIPQDGSEITLAIYFVHGAFVGQNTNLDDFSEVYGIMNSSAVLIGSMNISTALIKTQVDLDDLSDQHKDHNVPNLSQLNPEYHDWVYTNSTKTLSGINKANTTYIGTGISISGTSFTEAYVKDHGLDLGTGPYSSSVASSGRYAKGLAGYGYTSSLGDSGSITFYTDDSVAISQVSRDGNNITLNMVGVTYNNTCLEGTPWSNITGYGYFDVSLAGLTGMGGKNIIIYQKSTPLSLLPKNTAGAEAVTGTKFTQLTQTIPYTSVESYSNDIHILVPQDGTDIVIEIYHTEKVAGNLIATFTIKTNSLKTQVDLTELVSDHKDHNAGTSEEIMNGNYMDWTFDYSTRTTAGLPKANITFLGENIFGPPNIYVAVYYLDNLTGFHVRDDGLYPTIEMATGMTSYEIRSNYRDGKLTSVSVVAMIDQSELNPGKPVMTIRYDRETVTFKVNTTTRDVASWTEYTARYGETVTLPTVLRDNIPLTGWTSSPRITITPDVSTYTHTVGAGESGTINLTPQFNSELFVTITFVTPIGLYGENGQHRITVDVAYNSEYGVFNSLNDCPELINTEGYVLEGYDGLVFGARFTQDTTVTAILQSTNHNMVFKADVAGHCEVSGVKDSSSELLVVGAHNDLEYHSEITLTIKPSKGRALAIAETKEWAYHLVNYGELVDVRPSGSGTYHEQTVYYDQFGNCYSDSECTVLVYSIVWVYEGTEDKAHTIGYYTQYKIEGGNYYRQTGAAGSNNWVPCEPINIVLYKPSAGELISGSEGKFKMYCHDYEKDGTKFQQVVWQPFPDIGDPIKITEEGTYQWSFFLDSCVDLTVHTTEASVNINFVINGEIISDTDVLTVYSQDKVVISGYSLDGGQPEPVGALTYSDGKYYDRFGNCYRDAEGTKLEYSIVWVQESTYYLQYKITEGSVKTYERNTGTDTVGENVHWTTVGAVNDYYFKLETAYSPITGTNGHFTFNPDSDNYTREYKPAEYVRGINVPMYSNVYFGQTIVYDGITYNGVKWYTDRGCTNEFTFRNDRYEYLAKEDITLYTNIGYVSVFLHNNMGISERGALCQTHDGAITLPAIKYKLDGYIFVGWGLMDNGANVFTYGPESTFQCNETELHLYAYYLKGGLDQTHPYSGQEYTVSVDLCANTGEDTVVQFINTSDERLNIITKYSVNEEITSIDQGSADPPVFVDFTNSRVYFYGQIANGLNVATFSGSMGISITKIELFIIAPSKSQMYDPNKTPEQNTIFVSSADIQMIAATPTGEVPNPEDISAVILDTEMSGYTDRLSQIGSVRTAASIYFMEGKENNYIIHYVDGSLVLYDRESARYYYGGA